MADFDLGVYSDFSPLGDQVNEGKVESLLKAAREKEAILAAVSAHKKSNASSWSAQLGVADTPIVGTTVDLAASAVSGASRTLGHLVGSTGAIFSAMEDAAISDEDKKALARFLENKATPGDLIKLRTPDAEGKTPINRYTRILDIAEKGKDITDTFDLSSIQNNQDRQALNISLSKSYADAQESFDKGDTVTGIAKLLFGAGKSIVTNPKAVSEYIAENLPQLALGAQGRVGTALLGVSNVGYATEEYRKGIEAYMQNNAGALPSAALRNEMAVKAASLAVAEQLGEIGQLGAIGKVKNTAQRAKESADGFLKSVTKATGTGALEEGLTEAYQTGIENDLQGKAFSGEDVYKAGVIGAASGGALSGSGRAASKAAESMADMAKKGAEDRALTDAVKAAIESGDTSAIRDPKSPTYAPHKVVDVAIAKAMEGDLTTEEKKATFQSLNEIRTELEARKELIKVPVIPETPEQVQQHQEDLTQLQTELDSVAAQQASMKEKAMAAGKATEEEIDTKLKSIFGEAIDSKQKAIEDIQTILARKPRTEEEIATETKKIDSQLSYLNKRRDELGTLYSQVKPEKVNALVDEVTSTEIKSEDPVAVSESVNKVGKILTFAMANSDNLSIEQADKLASMTKGVTPEQKDYFIKHAEAKRLELAAKDLKKVSAEVFKGETDAFMGIDKYRREFSDAFESGDKKTADGLYVKLFKFTAGHQSKLNAIKKAIAIPGGAHIVKNNEGVWSVLPKRLDKESFEEQRAKRTALNIIPNNSQGILDAVTAEAAALKALAKESYSALNAVFPVTTKTTKGAVNESQATEAKQTETQGQEQQQESKQPVAQDLSTEQVAEDTSLVTDTQKQDLSVSVPKELTNALKKSETAIRKLTRANPKNLWSVLRNKMVDADLTDTFGKEWKKTRTMLKGKVGESLSTLVANGTLNDFLPFDLRDAEKELEAVEYIKEALRNKNHLTFETQIEIKAEGLNREAMLKELESLLTIQDIENEIEYTEQSEESTVTERIQADEQKSSTGIATPNVTKQTENLGKLSAFDTNTKDFSPMEALKESKLVSKFVKQVGSKLPLLQVKNFLSAWQGKQGNPDLIYSFLKTKKEDLNEKQVHALEVIGSELPRLVKSVESLYAKSKNESTLDKTKNIFHELMNADGKVDENISTAIAVAAIIYVSNYGSYHPSRDRSDTAKMLGVKEHLLEENNPDLNLQYQLSTAITTEEAARIGLGRIIGDILGLKTRDDNSPQDIAPRLKASLGAYAVALLKKEGMIESIEYVREKGERKGKPFENKSTVISFVRDADFNLNTDVAALVKGLSGTNGIIESAFGTEESPTMPTDKPVKSKQEFTQGTHNEVPKFLNETVNRDNASPRRADKGMLDVLIAVGKGATLAIAGSQLYDLETNPIDQQDGIKDKHRGLESEYDLAMEAIENTHLDSEMNLYEKNFFIQSAVLGIQRLVMKTRALNPMTSKIHRNVFYSPAWNTEITANDTDLINLLKVSIATGLGLNPDTNHQEDLIAQLDNKIKTDPTLIKALELIDKVLYPQSTGDSFVFKTEADKQVLVDATAEEGMMSLKALVSLAQLQHAIKTDFAEPLNTNHMFGIDGKVNGTALAHMSYGTDDLDSVGPQTGFYPLSENGPKNFVEFATDGKGLDVYQKTILEVMRVQNVIPPGYKEKYKEDFVQRYTKVLNSISAITGSLGSVTNSVVEKVGRNMVKEPITALHFGSGINSVSKAASADFIATYLKTLKKSYTKYANTDKDAAETKRLVDALNSIMGNVYTNTTKIRATTLTELMNTQLTDDQVNALREGFEDTLGTHIGNTFKRVFKDYLAKRDAIVKASSVAYNMYISLKTLYTNQMIDQAVASGAIASFVGKNKKRYAAYDLSANQKAKIDAKLGKAMPMVHTILSKREDNVKAGLMLAKSTVGPNNAPVYTSQVFMPNPTGKDPIKVNISAESFYDAPPSVSPVSATVHSLESAIMQLTRAQFEGALNINDELGIGIGQAKEAATAINKNTAELIAEYSPLVEVLNTVTGVLEVFTNQNNLSELLKLFKENVLKDEFSRRDFESNPDLAEMSVADQVHTYIQSIVTNLYDETLLGEVRKHTFLSNLGFVDQYPMEGGQYVVPQEFRDAAAKKADGAHLDPIKEKMNTLLETMKEKIDENAIVEIEAEIENWMEGFEPELTPEESESVDLYEDIKYDFTADVMNRFGSLQGDVMFNIMDKVSKYLPDNLNINYLSLKEAEAMPNKPDGSVNGWFSHDTATGSNEIYLIKERLTQESYLHETTHAALFWAIEKANQGKDLEAVKLVKELTDVMNKVSKAEGADKFSAALKDVHEFVTWGLTNQGFQEFLKGVEYQSKNTGNKFTNALRSTFDLIFGFFLGNKVNDTAFQALLINSFALTEFAKENIADKGKLDSDLTKAMVTQAKDVVNNYTTVDIYNALGTVKPGFSASFDNHLKGLLDGIVRSLRGPFGTLTPDQMTNQTITPLDVWTNSVVSGKAPLVSKLSKSGVRMTAQERFVAQQVEAVINDAIANPEVKVSAAMQELIKLFNTAKTSLQPKDFYTGNWDKATQQNKAKAQAMYDFLFNVKSNNGRSDYIGNFVALGLSNEKVNKALNISSGTVNKKALIGSTIAETLTNVFEFLLNLYTDLATKTTKDMQINEKLSALTETLVNIEAKKRNVLKRQIESKIDPALDVAGRKASKAIRGLLVKLLNNPIFSKHNLATVRATALGARMVLEDRIPVVLDMMTKMRNEFNTQKHGLAMNLFNDVKGYGKRVSAFIRMATALNAEREHIAAQLSKVILSGFKDNGDYLTDDDHKIITAGLLRTGAHVLIGKYSMADISELLTNQKKLNSAISVIEQELLNRFKSKGNYFIYQSKGLAALMVLGNSVTPSGQLTNALMISKEANGSPNKLSESDQKDVEIMVDELSTLYGLMYMETANPGSAKQLAKLIDIENSKEGGAVSGILEVMTLQAKLNNDVKDTLFSGSEVLMRKGYLPEIVNPHTSFEIGDVDTATAKDFADRGYEEGVPLATDPADTVTGKKALYVLRDGAPSVYVSGAIQLDSNKSKGSKIIGNNRNLNTNEGVMNASELAKVNQHAASIAARAYLPSALTWNPMQAKPGNFMVPLFNANMEIVNWRYEMSHTQRDGLLERDNRVQEVISTMAATTFGKETAAQQNKAVVEALHQDYKRNFNLNRGHFIYVSPLSDDTELREIWNILPYQMKQDIKEVTGDGKGLWIRKEHVLPVFGYRKYSLSEIWTKTDKLNMMEEAFKNVVEWLLEAYARTVLHKSPNEAEAYGKRAYIYVRRGQRAWEEIVAQVKDIVVIRTGTVMLGNIISNFSLLKANGVPLSEIIKNHHVAIKAYKQFDANSIELFELETEKKLGFLRGDAANKESRINQLQEAINSSPIKKLIDAGLRPSIVEDLADIDDQYSYKSSFMEKTDKYVNKINPTVRNVAKQVLITKNSELYKALSKTTQMSDFVARYVLFEHLTNRKDNPLSDREAIFEVSEAFINYDIPMAKGMQFVDDMGFTPFIKYFFRIQRVLLKTAKEHPMQMLGLIALNHFQSSLPLVTDSSFVSHIGNNPFRAGAAQIFTVWDETLVLDQLSKLVK